MLSQVVAGCRRVRWHAIFFFTALLVVFIDAAALAVSASSSLLGLLVVCFARLSIIFIVIVAVVVVVDVVVGGVVIVAGCGCEFNDISPTCIQIRIKSLIKPNAVAAATRLRLNLRLTLPALHTRPKLDHIFSDFYFQDLFRFVSFILQIKIQFWFANASLQIHRYPLAILLRIWLPLLIVLKRCRYISKQFIICSYLVHHLFINRLFVYIHIIFKFSNVHLNFGM